MLKVIGLPIGLKATIKKKLWKRREHTKQHLTLIVYELAFVFNGETVRMNPLRGLSLSVHLAKRFESS